VPWLLAVRELAFRVGFGTARRNCENYSARPGQEIFQAHPELQPRCHRMRRAARVNLSSPCAPMPATARAKCKQAAYRKRRYA
jgi:hypothetical protein